MTKHDSEGNKLGEVIINREGFMLVESCETRFLQVSATMQVSTSGLMKKIS